jgi:hypothetical protein
VAAADAQTLSASRADHTDGNGGGDGERARSHALELELARARRRQRERALIAAASSNSGCDESEQHAEVSGCPACERDHVYARTCIYTSTRDGHVHVVGPAPEHVPHRQQKHQQQPMGQSSSSSASASSLPACAAAGSMGDAALAARLAEAERSVAAAWHHVASLQVCACVIGMLFSRCRLRVLSFSSIFRHCCCGLFSACLVLLQSLSTYLSVFSCFVF